MSPIPVRTRSRASMTSRTPRSPSQYHAKLLAPSTIGNAYERATAAAATRIAPTNMNGSSAPVLPAASMRRRTRPRREAFPSESDRTPGKSRAHTVVPVTNFAMASSGVATTSNHVPATTYTSHRHATAICHSTDMLRSEATTTSSTSNTNSFSMGGLGGRCEEAPLPSQGRGVGGVGPFSRVEYNPLRRRYAADDEGSRPRLARIGGRTRRTKTKLPRAEARARKARPSP